MRVQVDHDKCNWSWECVTRAPRVFGQGPDGELELLTERPLSLWHEDVREAVKWCPTGAIVVEEDR